MILSWKFLYGLFTLAVFLAAVGWVLWRWLKASQDDPVVLILKWIVSAGVLVVAVFAVPVASFVGPFIIVGCAVVLSLLWTPNIGGKLGGWMSGGMDGGSIEPEPKPHYSLAEGMRKRGRYREAAAEVRKQLEKFPSDFQCETTLAEIHADHLGEFGIAEAVLERIANNPRRPPHERAYALNQLADWHLKFHQNPDSARAVLERLQQFLPGTEFARVAAQRIGHLTDPAARAEAAERAPIFMPQVQEDFTPEQHHATEAEGEVHEELGVLVEHLRAHPQDAEARENLARLYAERLDRADLAVQEVEKLVGAPNQSPREIARRLNLKADFQVKYAADLDGARATLRRIAEQFPDSAWATGAEQRLGSLKNELRGKEKSQTLRLGSYEDDLGLR